MYMTKGFIFQEVNGEIQKLPFRGIPAKDYEEVHEVMKEMKIEHYMFVLKEVKE